MTHEPPSRPWPAGRPGLSSGRERDHEPRGVARAL